MSGLEFNVDYALSGGKKLAELFQQHRSVVATKYVYKNRLYQVLRSALATALTSIN